MINIKDEKISSSQLLFLLVTVVSATAFLFVPAITSEKAGNDGWMSVAFIATGFGIIVALICTKLGAYFPQQSVVEFAPQILGKYLGKMIGLSYVFFFIHINAIIVREFGDFLASAFLPETPLMVFNIIVILLAASAARNGLEVISRMNQFVFPLFMGVWFIIIFLNIQNMNYENLLPVLDNGIKPILAGGLTPGAWRGEVVIILMFFPYLNKSGEARNTVIFAVLVIAVILTALSMASTLVFGSTQDAHFVFPSLELAKYVSVGDFIERVEAVIVIVWVAGITIKVAAFYLASVLAAAQVLNVKKYRPLVVPVGIITLVYSQVLFENSRELVHFLSKVFPFYAYVFELFIPLGLLLVAIIRKKAGPQNG